MRLCGDVPIALRRWPSGLIHTGDMTFVADRRQRACPPVEGPATTRPLVSRACGSPKQFSRPLCALGGGRHRPVDRRDKRAPAPFDGQLAGLCARRRGRRCDDQRDECMRRVRRRRSHDGLALLEPPSLVHEMGVEPVRHRHSRNRHSRTALVQYRLLQPERVIAPRTPLCLLLEAGVRSDSPRGHR